MKNLNSIFYYCSISFFLLFSFHQENLVRFIELPLQSISNISTTTRSGPPKLTLNSKPGTRQANKSKSTFCTLVNYRAYNQPEFNSCLKFENWFISYKSKTKNRILVNNRVTLAGSTFIGLNISPGVSLDLELDLSGLPISDGTKITLSCEFSDCSSSPKRYLSYFPFTKDCNLEYPNKLQIKTKEKAELSIMPNPVFNNTTIDYYLPSSGKIDLSICDVNGRLVKQINVEKKSSGNHQINLSVNHLQNGIYYLVLKTKNSIVSKKMLILNH